MSDNAAPHVLPPLPYAENALDPVISCQYHRHPLWQAPSGLRRCLEQVASRHGTGRVLRWNKLIADDRRRKPTRVAIFNNAAQLWNHTFYWRSLRPQGGGEPSAGSKRNDRCVIRRNLDACRSSWRHGDEPIRQRSGSAPSRSRHAKVRETGDAGTPLTKGVKPLLTIDVSEHAYSRTTRTTRRTTSRPSRQTDRREFAADNLGSCLAEQSRPQASAVEHSINQSQRDRLCARCSNSFPSFIRTSLNFLLER